MFLGLLCSCFFLLYRNKASLEVLRKMTALLQFAATGEASPALVSAHFHSKIENRFNFPVASAWVFLSPNKGGESLEKPVIAAICDMAPAQAAVNLVQQHALVVPLNRLPYRIDNKQVWKNGTYVRDAVEKLVYTDMQLNAFSYILEANLTVFDYAFADIGS